MPLCEKTLAEATEQPTIDVLPPACVSSAMTPPFILISIGLGRSDLGGTPGLGDYPGDIVPTLPMGENPGDTVPGGGEICELL